MVEITPGIDKDMASILKELARNQVFHNYPPSPFGFYPSSLGNFVSDLDVLGQFIFLLETLKIACNLRRVGIYTRPVRLWLERVGIIMGWYVASASTVT